MKCLVCHVTVPENCFECPQCGEHLGQWSEMNSVGQQFYEDGLYFAHVDRGVKAALCLAKASVFRPTDPNCLAALGKVLAQHGEYDDAALFLGKAISIAESQDLTVTDNLKSALAKAEELAEQPDASPLLELVPFVRNNADAANEIIPPPEARTGEEADHPSGVQTEEAGDPSESSVNAGPSAFASEEILNRQGTPPLEQAWKIVTGLEQRGSDFFKAIGPVLSWPMQFEDGFCGPWLYLQALSALVDGDKESAEKLFHRSLEEDTSHRNAEIYLASLGFLANEIESVIQLFKQHEHDTDDIAKTLLICSKVLGAREGEAREIEFLECFLNAAPELADHFRKKLATLYFSSNRYEEACPYLKQLVTELPDSEYFQKFLVKTFERLDHVEEGVAFYQTLDEEKPGHWRTKFSLARLCWKLREYEKAVEVFEGGLALENLSDEGAYHLHCLLAECSEKLGHSDTTQEHLKAALEISPDDKQIRDWLKRVESTSAASDAVATPPPEQ